MRRNSFGLALVARRPHGRAGRRRAPSPRRPRRPPPAAPAAPPRPSTRSPPRRRSTRCTPAATPSTPRWPRPACSASSSRSRAASAAAASWSSAPPGGKVTTIDGRETAPAPCGRTRSSRTATPAGVRRCPLQRPLGRRARHAVARGTRRCASTASISLAQALQPGIRAARAASRSTRRSSTGRSGKSTTSTTSRRPRRSTWTPTARRATSARRCATPTWPRPTSGSPSSAAQGLLRRRRRQRDGRRGARSADRPDADHTWRKGLMTTRRPQALRRRWSGRRAGRVPRPERLRHGAAVQRRHDRRRGAEHPQRLRLRGAKRAQALQRYLEASRYSFADRGALSRRPGLLRGAGRGPAVSTSFAAERRALITDRAANAPSRPATRTTTRASDRAGRRDGLDLAPEPVDDPPHRGGPQGNDGVLHVHDRVHGRQRHRGAGLRVPAQQRADGLRLRLPEPSEPRRGRQAPAQLDGADDGRGRAASRGWRSARRAARRSRAPCCRRSSTGSTSRSRSPTRSRSRARSSATRASTQAEQVVHRLAARARTSWRWATSSSRPTTPRRRRHPEIGATTAVEFRGGDRFTAAAEPQRRGIGSAGVVRE